MSQSVIADNWSLQNISELFVNGISPDVAHLITPNTETDSHTYDEIPSAIIAIEALFDLITDVVLRDQVLVEEKFVGAWKNKDSPLNKLAEQSVVRAFPFLHDPKQIAGPRDEFVRRLCLTSSLKQEHQENVAGWTNDRQPPNPYLSQALWGGAGMLARAFIHEKACTPHPVRKRLFQNAGIALSGTDAKLRACSTIKEKRASIRALQGGGDELYSLQLDMEPLAIKVIRESESPSDIPTIALQMRDEYVELRNWLGLYQQSIGAGDYKDIQKHQKVLTSISRYVDAAMGKIDPDAVTFTTGISILKVVFKASPINTLKNQFGVRAMINKLILGASGDAELKKLLRFFGHHNTSIGLKVIEHFSSRDRT